MTLLEYAESEIRRLGLGDDPTNCHGVVASEERNGLSVRLSDGIGLNAICLTHEQIDVELREMRDWYDEIEKADLTAEH